MVESLRGVDTSASRDRQAYRDRAAHRRRRQQSLARDKISAVPVRLDLLQSSLNRQNAREQSPLDGRAALDMLEQ